jgi:hypothetical protein
MARLRFYNYTREEGKRNGSAIGELPRRAAAALLAAGLFVGSALVLGRPRAEERILLDGRRSAQPYFIQTASKERI